MCYVLCVVYKVVLCVMCYVLCVVYKVVSPAAAWCEAAVSADDRTRVSTQTPSMSITNAATIMGTLATIFCIIR